MKRTARFAIVVAIFASVCWAMPTANRASDNRDERDPVLKRADVYCTGFISDFAPNAEVKIVGGDRENMQDAYAQGQVVFLNKGRESGIRSGAVYYVLRPMGVVKHPFKKKKKIGYFVRELGMVRVIEVHANTAVAEVLVSCEDVLLGDLLKPYEEQTAPAPRDPRPLPRYGESSGGITGQIVMSPRHAEYFSANTVAFIDLGSRQGVQPGDYFTIFRQINRRERVVNAPKDNVSPRKSDGYQSRHYHGGTFSQAAPAEPKDKIYEARPQIPRKVLGEMIILKVENNTAVALITRTTEEVNIGDFVEKSN